jgi:DNA primase
MSIEFDKFLEWAESRFGDVVIKGDEILVNSIFCEDRKHHLWCNPSGGKTNSESGVYHCWKSDSKGSLIGLVMQVDKCSYEQACEILDASKSTMAELEKKVQDIFDQKYKKDTSEKEEEVTGLGIPFGCYLFKDLPSSNAIKNAAEEYLLKRLLNTDGLMVGTSGRYRNRILIPYYDKSGSLIYYNGRYIGDPGTNLRYLGPPKELGIGKGDVIYMQNWPTKGEKIYIAEGEFDAMSLSRCGFCSAALGGKSMTDKQMDMIRDYIPVLCLDADDSGADALTKMAGKLLSKGFNNVSYIRPCLEFKDWNGLLVAKGEKILKNYIRTQERKYNTETSAGDWESTRLSINKIMK